MSWPWPVWGIVLGGWLVAGVVAALLWILFRRNERAHLRTEPPEEAPFGGRPGDPW